MFPVIELGIEANGRAVDLPAIVDTGAQHTLLSPQYAVDIGLIPAAGRRMIFTAANGSSFSAFGHTVQVRVLDETFQAELFFPEVQLRRCLLGRDLMARMQIGLNESLSILYLF
ncbi:MAG: retropepsin-like domain-containing protein [Bacteroidetes bacterium]|nr:retropepsin-like domain-containing protein [Bacteroidota bacterium]MCW5895903.1 retropepsin-like domain-containing protein [Bacteroidota bacterium]